MLHSKTDHWASNKQAPNLIPIKLTCSSTLSHTPAIHRTHTRNTHGHSTPKQTHSTPNTPPLSRTDPHKLTHNESMFGHARCGAGWSVSVTPACPSRLIWGFLTNIKGKVGRCDAMQRFSSHCLFLLLLMEWSGGEKWSEKSQTYDDQVFFPSSWECFTL